MVGVRRGVASFPRRYEQDTYEIERGRERGTRVTREEVAERSAGKLVAATLPLMYDYRRDSYGKVSFRAFDKART